MTVKKSLWMRLKVSGLSVIISTLLAVLPVFAEIPASSTPDIIASDSIIASTSAIADVSSDSAVIASDSTIQGVATTAITLQNATESAAIASEPAAAASMPPALSGQKIMITATGDIMMHQRQLDTHYNKDSKSYTFDDDYIHILEELKKADLLIGNLETTFGGPDQKYSGYPLFNTPDSLGDALKRAGFHVLSTANNHCLDTGVAGLKRTVKILKELGFGVLGTRQTPEETGSLLRDIKGIKVGMLSYTYETGRRDNAKTLNGGLMPKEAHALIDSFSPAHQEEALVDMKKRIAGLQKDGAELIVMYMHWGVEYGAKPTAAQNQLAEALASAGVDIIFGSHPHVVQTATFIPRADGKRTFVAWSLGNFISNQRYEFLDRHDTEDGLVVSVTVERSPEGTVKIAKVDYQSIWVHRHNSSGQWLYHIVPLPQALLNPQPYNFDHSNLVRARNSLIRTQEVIKDAPEWKAFAVPELPAK